MTGEYIFIIPGQPVAKGRPRGSAPKATNEQLVEAYATTPNVWKVADLFGMCGQSVYERLVRLGKINKMRVLTAPEKELIEAVYASGVKCGDGKLKDLSAKINRTVPFISRYAGKIGVSDQAREMTNEARESISRRSKLWYSNNDHPKGFLGGKHSQSAKLAISASSTRHWVNMSEDERDAYSMRASIAASKRTSNNREKASWKSGWREIGGVKKYYRSSWEANYAHYLEWLRTRGEILSWEHEPETFWFQGIKRGTMSYLPDFKVVEKNGAVQYHEVKGWMDARSKTTIARMAKYHPKIKLIVIDGKAYRKIAKTMKPIIGEWE